MRITNFKSLINKYEFFIFDQWGVIHNGGEKYEFIDKTLKYLNLKKKSVFFYLIHLRLQKKIIWKH